MLLELYPRVHRRYTSLPIIGPTLDGYGTWLLAQGYSTDRAREYFRAAPRLARQLEQRGVRTLAGITRARLQGCAPADSQEDPDLAALVRQLDRYFRTELSLYAAPALTRNASPPTRPTWSRSVDSHARPARTIAGPSRSF